ncbi:MAG TPA: hypothetical protein VHK88_20145 [Aquihabitans sp.]|jgi:hypothetical protein|nr:hypothetical protein [Aquihabitans sp.]
MIGYLLRWACPASAVATQRRNHGLLGHRSWQPTDDDPLATPHAIDHGGADLDDWPGSAGGWDGP